MNVREMLSAEQIADRVRWIGRAVSEDYAGKDLTVVAVLKGSFVFAADLVRQVRVKGMTVDFLGVSSYGDGTESSGVVRVTNDLARPVDGRHVLVVEDIVDTGLTLSFLIDQLKSRGAASVAVCALLHKPARQKVPVRIDYLGFTIEDKFVVGYGLDAAEQHRELPYIGVVG